MPATKLDAAFDHNAYEGFIFDCDGTLADSMPLHFQAWTETLTRKLGRPSDFTESLFYHFGGMPPRQIVERLNHDFGYNLPQAETAEEKEARFVELLPGIGPVPEVVEVLKGLGREAKVAVASGGQTDIVWKTLGLIGIAVGPDEVVKLVVGSDQVTQGKPSPELFLLTAKRLGVDPKRCLVFEDAGPGFVAAQAAGMDHIDIRPFRTSGVAAAAKY
jgi:beta-phosphoglucomutase-like phosphatase (HAD superfamily)